MEKMLLHTAEPGQLTQGHQKRRHGWSREPWRSSPAKPQPCHRLFPGAGAAGQERGVGFCKGRRGGGQGEEWGKCHLSVLERPLEALLFTQCSG